MRHMRLSLALLTAALVLATAFILAGASTLRASPPAQAADGQAIYAQRCAICHGAEGDGNGPGAVNLDPKPRDFRRGYEVAGIPLSTEVGQDPAFE